jgi:hypothetical protein
MHWHQPDGGSVAIVVASALGTPCILLPYICCRQAVGAIHIQSPTALQQA